MSDKSEAPLPVADVRPLVEPHLDTLALVLIQGWAALVRARRKANKEMAQATAGSRGMLVSDFMREPAHRLFAGSAGVRVDDRFQRPWVNFDGGTIQVRFKKLTPSLAICRSDSVRHTRLAFHLGDPLLPGMPQATILTAGYILNAAETAIDAMALVCHLGAQVNYSIRLPGGTATAAAPTQLPLTPLSRPIIRSARASALERLSDGGPT